MHDSCQRRCLNSLVSWRSGRGLRWFAACLVAALVVVTGGLARGADSDDPIIAEIDRLIRAGWSDNEVQPSDRASDGEYARRVYLDVVGHIPALDDLQSFLSDTATDKRRRLVDKLLDDPAYIKNWSNLWANILVGRANNRGNRPGLERWLRDALYRNVAYDKFVYELIAAEGDSQQNGAVNFLAAHLNEQAVPATAITARVFLGMQVQCTQCHNHPFNDWKQAQFWGLNAFFRGTRVAGGNMRGEFELTDSASAPLVYFERRSGLQEAVGRTFVDGTLVFPAENEDEEVPPRVTLAKMMTDPARPYLAATEVNRVWGHFFGYGFTKPVDDMGPHNAPSHPELVEYLSKEFTSAGFDVKRLIRWVAGSEAYNLTSRTNETNRKDDPAAGQAPLFAHMYLKNFSAEQLYDSLIIATEAHKANRNDEAAETQRRAWLNQFIQTFGTDENDESTTFNGTIPQALVMMNGDLIRSALSDARGGFLQKLLTENDRKLTTPAKKGAKAEAKPPAKAESKALAKGSASKKGAAPVRKAPPALQKRIDTLFLVALARLPNEEELGRVNEVYQAGGISDTITGMQDLFWAILNSNEFIINH